MCSNFPSSNFMISNKSLPSTSKVATAIVSTDPQKAGYIHYNVQIPHDDSVDAEGNIDTIAKFSENRTVPIVDRPSDYLFAIERFSVSGSNIPILISEIQSFSVFGNTDPNLTTLSVTLQRSGNIAQAFVIYESESINLPVPPPLSAQNPLPTRGPYYFVFSYYYQYFD